MGDILSKHSANQKTENYQATANNNSTASSVRNQGKGASNAVGGGISLVLNTGGNKVSTKKGGGGKKGTGGTGAGTDSTKGSGAINVAITQTDAGAIEAGNQATLAAIGAVQDANQNVITLAEHALQAGADVAAVAIPTYAATEIAGNAINPQPVIVSTGTDSGAPDSSNKILIGLVVVVAAIGLGAMSKGH